MNSEQCLNDILEYLEIIWDDDEFPIRCASDKLGNSLIFLKFNTILFVLDKCPKIIIIQKERGLFNLKVHSEENYCLDYWADVSPEDYIVCDSINKYFNKKLCPVGHDPFDYSERVLIERCEKIPAIKLPLSQWPFSDPPVPVEVRNKFPWFYAIPWKNPKTTDDRNFTVCAPQWEDELLKQQPKSMKILNLITSLSEQHATSLPKLTPLMLRTVVLNQLPVIDWQRDWVSLLSEMWTRLADNLRAGRLDSFLVDGLNLLDCMDSKELKQCVATTQKILFQILEARYSNTCEDAEILFDIY